MFMQIRKFEIKGADADGICKQSADELTPILKQLPGYIDYYVVNTGQGNVFSVTVFEDQAGVLEAQKKARAWSADKVDPKTFVGPEILQGEIIRPVGFEKDKTAA